MLAGSKSCRCLSNVQPSAQRCSIPRVAVRPALHSRQIRENRLRHISRAVDYRIAAPPVRYDHSGTADEVRTLLTKLGWERAWIDGITERIFKMEFSTTVGRVEEVVKLLEGLGLPTHWVCNLASRVPAFLGRDPKTELQPVLDYIKARGISGEPFLRLLREYPRLLLFTPSADGKVLQLGDCFAEVDVVNGKGHVSYWRKGAAFETAPVSPRQPSA